MLKFYRFLPLFKGKLRLGKILFKSIVNKQVSIEFSAHQNIQYKIPNTVESLGLELLINGIYEKDIVQFLSSHLKSEDVYFDIGANIGAIGLPVIKDKPGIKYVGFEASPLVFDYLQYNFNKNEIENYNLHNYVVHENDNQPMKFYQSEQYGKSSLIPMYSQQYILVSSISLDSFCADKNIAKINWMKVDVQGFELYVFKGMQQLLLNRSVHNILFEFEYWAEEAAGLKIGAAQQYLADLGYELFETSGKKLKSILTNGSAMIWARPRAD